MPEEQRNTLDAGIGAMDDGEADIEIGVDLSEDKDEAVDVPWPYQLTNEEIANRFNYHAPKDDQPERYEIIRSTARTLAYRFNETCPPSRELSLAFTKLEEAVMFANAAIARRS